MTPELGGEDPLAVPDKQIRRAALFASIAFTVVVVGGAAIGLVKGTVEWRLTAAVLLCPAALWLAVKGRKTGRTVFSVVSFGLLLVVLGATAALFEATG